MLKKNGLVKWEQLLIRNELTYNVPIFVWLILFFIVLALIVYSMLAVIWKKRRSCVTRYVSACCQWQYKGKQTAAQSSV